MSKSMDAILEHQHTSDAIQNRLAGDRKAGHLRDFVFGGIDGVVTTFAIVAGVEGAKLPAGVALALGCANLLADGFSMAASNFLGTKAETTELARVRDLEHRHVEHVPEGEREEIRQIYAQKGFEGDLLERVVDVLTRDRTRWVETMLVEEHGLRLSPPSPSRAALVTFIAFVVCGGIPLLPLMPLLWGPPTPLDTIFWWSCGCAALVFAAVGWFKGKILGASRWRSALETLALGGFAAWLAYAVGAAFQVSI